MKTALCSAFAIAAFAVAGPVLACGDDASPNHVHAASTPDKPVVVADKAPASAQVKQASAAKAKTPAKPIVLAGTKTN